LFSLRAITQETQIKRDPNPNKDFANVFYNHNYTLFDYFSDEPILPDEKSVYKFYYATSQQKYPEKFEGSIYDAELLPAFKFVNRSNCKEWCSLDLKSSDKFKSPLSDQIINSNPVGTSHSSNNDIVPLDERDVVRKEDKIFWYKDGSAYFGDKKKGNVEGFGRRVFADDSKYYGEFINGFFNGLGIYTNKQGNKYEGLFFLGVK
jgi:hypothetical protein